MTKFSLALLSAATLALGACSSEPSDFRPNQKVSVDAVAAGTRKTGLYPSEDRADGRHEHAAGHHEGAAAEAHNPADASEAASTGSDVQKSGEGEPAVNTTTPASRAAADSAEAAETE